MEDSAVKQDLIGSSAQEEPVVLKENKSNLEEVYNKRKPSRDVVWAIFMVSIGIVLLMNSFGLLSWSIWTILWRFWPILLILGGMQLLLGRSSISKILIAIFSVILINFVIFISVLSLGGGLKDWFVGRIDEGFINKVESWVGGNWESVEKTIIVSSDDFENVISRDLNVEIGAAEFNISDDEDLQDYLLLNSVYYKGYNEPNLKSSSNEDVLDLDFDTETNPGFWTGRFDNVLHDFTLGDTDLETNLVVDLDAGKGTLSFESLNLKQIQASVGAGSLEFHFKEDSIPSDGIILDVNAGSSLITLPKDVSVKVRYDVGAGSLVIGEKNISGLGRDGVYETEDYDESEVKIDLNVEIGAGKVEIDFK